MEKRVQMLTKRKKTTGQEDWIPDTWMNFKLNEYSEYISTSIMLNSYSV